MAGRGQPAAIRVGRPNGWRMNERKTKQKNKKPSEGGSSSTASWNEKNKKENEDLGKSIPPYGGL